MAQSAGGWSGKKAPSLGCPYRARGIWGGDGPWALPTATMAQVFGLKGELPFSVQNRALHEQPSIQKIWDLNTATMAQAFGLNAYGGSGVTVTLSKFAAVSSTIGRSQNRLGPAEMVERGRVTRTA